MGIRKPARAEPSFTEAAVARRVGFARLAFEQFRGGLQSYLLRRLRHVDNAQDLAQEVYLRLLRFGDGELVQRPEAYVYRVAFNVLCEHQLRERRDVVHADSNAVAQLGEEMDGGGESMEDAVEREQRENRMDDVLALLPPMQRAVFLLAARQDVPHEEIAGRLGISLHTVRKYLYRALLFCRLRLAE